MVRVLMLFSTPYKVKRSIKASDALKHMDDLLKSVKPIFTETANWDFNRSETTLLTLGWTLTGYLNRNRNSADVCSRSL